MTARAEFQHRIQAPRSSFGEAIATDEAARRALNVLVAIVGIIITFPLMVAIAIAIAFTSPGPILYRQKRVGINRRGSRKAFADLGRSQDVGGQLFTIYKFRTMRVEQSAAQVWATADDARITPVGRVLRRLRLDELPQLFNVVHGEMNVVGPRPEQPQIFEKLRQVVPAYAVRQRVLPGITGWAQINQHYDATIEDVKRKVALDLEYIKRRSFREDVRIMLRTLPVMIGAKLGW